MIRNHNNFLLNSKICNTFAQSVIKGVLFYNTSMHIIAVLDTECHQSVGKNNLDFTEARESEWQWHQLGHMQVWTSLQTENHASTSTLSFLQAGCPSCHPTNSVKAPKAHAT